MAYIQGENREQLTLIPMCLDDLISPDSICRVIAAYVASLDMAELGFKYAETKETGRPPYSPESMLSLYLYGYLNRIRSSRRLETETHRNIEVMWIMEKLTPDDKTICNFRKDNSKALKKAFREFSLWCNKLGLYGKTLVGVDGTKIRANASRRSIHTQETTQKQLEQVENKIEKYLNELEENDKNETDEPKLSPEKIREILEHLNGKKTKLQDLLMQIEANGGEAISTVDPDAHLMHTNGDGRRNDANYNVQAVADSKHNLIVDFEVTACANDVGALPKMTESAKEIMGVREISATGDKGYYNGPDISKCEENGTTCYIAQSETGTHAPDENYDKKHFKYDPEKDCHTCPEGARLPFKHIKNNKDGTVNRVYFDRDACKNCPNREKCTTNKRDGRTIVRTAYQDALDTINARMKTDEGTETLRERKKIIEHPFGTIKAVWGYRQFLCRGKEKTSAEMSLTFLAYNFRRVFNIFKENDKNMLEAMA